MKDYRWFAVQGPVDDEVFVRRLGQNGFVLHEDEYVDANNRKVVLGDSVRVAIPVSDVIGEEEQLEFVLGQLGLDDDDVHEV